MGRKDKKGLGPKKRGIEKAIPSSGGSEEDLGANQEEADGK